MVDSIRQAFINNLENVKWMDNQTNQAAKEKVKHGHKGRLINNVIGELKHRRLRDANGSRKLNPKAVVFLFRSPFASKKRLC